MRFDETFEFLTEQHRSDLAEISAGQYPSQIILFRKTGLISATERERFIDTIRNTGLADEDIAKAWDATLTIGWFRRKVAGDNTELFPAR